jgi:vancomycin resistance protein YoaR
MKRRLFSLAGGFGGKWRKEGFSRTGILITALAGAVVVGGAAALLYALGFIGGPTAAELNSDTFYSGVYVDDISLGGLTMDEARRQVEAKQNAFANSNGVTVTGFGQSWLLKIADADRSYDTQAILRQAWSQGREGSDRDRRSFIRKLPANPVKLTTALTVDPSKLEQQVRALSAPFAVAPVDATFAGYDMAKPDGQRLSFTPDIPGSRVDDDALWEGVKAEFVNGTFGAVQMAVIPVQANLMLSELQADMQLVVRFHSTMKDHSTPRYTNIKLACAAISGRFLLPGETFSFNDATGPRTAAKGYQTAHIINGGVVDNGLAGGTCQVSGTLWNAAARADLAIVERNAHTLRSAYLPLGQDATVDYGHYDLKFMNDKDAPVLLIMYIGTGDNKYDVFAEVYGAPLPGGETIQLLTEKTATVPAPNTVSYAPSDAVKRGTTETVKPHDGVKATTYKLYMQGGKEVNRVLLHKDYYKEAGTIVVYNPADGLPTPTPAATPTMPMYEPVPTLTPGHGQTHAP